MTQDLVSALFELIIAADRPGANRLIDDWARLHGYRRAVVEILEPALGRLGELWASDAISLAQGYVSAKIAADVMTKAAEAEPADPGAPKKGVAVVGNIEDDFHGLGRKLVVTFLRIAGWEIHDLGNDILPQLFIDRADEVGAKIIGASAMMLSTARNIVALRELIDQRGPEDQLQLAVGGAVFCARPELVSEVGGDGTARNAFEAPALFNRLLATANRARDAR